MSKLTNEEGLRGKTRKGEEGRREEAWRKRQSGVGVNGSARRELS